MTPRPDNWTESPIAFVDTETDGVHPGRRPWEIAIVRREPDGTETTWSHFIEIDLRSADLFGLRVGRFYDRHPLGRALSGVSRPDERWILDTLPVKVAAFKVAQLTHGAHIIGAVPNFDTETLAPLLRDHGLTPTWHHHLQCIETLGIGFLAAHGVMFRPPYGSDEITAALGIAPTPPEERHTALGDVRWAMRVYDRVLSGAPPAAAA